jgi:SAM-dependent methyltransferase
MKEKSRSNSYPLGAQKDTLPRYRVFNEIYQPGTIERFATIPISSDMHILEVGCGIGETACYMAKSLVPNGHVTAFDQSAELIDLARAQALDAGIGNVTFECVTAQEFDFPKERFDVAHSRFVLSYITDARDIVRKIYDTLKPSGYFFGEEVAQSYIMHGQSGWYDDINGWYVGLVERGGGDPEYGLNRLPSDMLEAGFKVIRAGAYWPIDDQSKIIEMIQLTVSREMKPNLIRLGLAKETEVDAVVTALIASDDKVLISPPPAIQLIGHKPKK